ncbi:MAG: VanZ family protein [Winogradskyella sp.]|uniref:VanZ family protein n=1 Tax=Winogradskyella sp. TaxID=1883156 RepID=UPI00182F6B08|nr:VanZ family protein [Winogradskyella sp.]
MKTTKYFTSKKERHFWFWAFMVFIAIFSTLFLGGQLFDLLVRQGVLEQTTFFLFLLLVLVFLLSGWQHKAQKLNNLFYLGVICVYGMAILRMNITIAERSHIFEYGLLAILIYHALHERKKNGIPLKYLTLKAIIITGTIGTLDEVIQIVIPYRIFDIIDIAFNFFASAFGVLLHLGVRQLQNVLFKQK